jgi:hypothetical protein
VARPGHKIDRFYLYNLPVWKNPAAFIQPKVKNASGAGFVPA